jgi:hypothetical protein
MKSPVSGDRPLAVSLAAEGKHDAKDATAAACRRAIRSMRPCRIDLSLLARLTHPAERKGLRVAAGPRIAARCGSRTNHVDQVPADLAQVGKAPVPTSPESPADSNGGLRPHSSSATAPPGRCLSSVGEGRQPVRRAPKAPPSRWGFGGFWGQIDGAGGFESPSAAFRSRAVGPIPSGQQRPAIPGLSGLPCPAVRFSRSRGALWLVLERNRLLGCTLRPSPGLHATPEQSAVAASPFGKADRRIRILSRFA